MRHLLTAALWLCAVVAFAAAPIVPRTSFAVPTPTGMGQALLIETSETNQFILVLSSPTAEGGVVLSLHTFTVGESGPEPGPDPTPDPDPPPPPPPPPVQNIFAVIVEETDDRDELSAAQVAALDSTEIRDYMAEHGHQFRVVDQDVKGPDGKRPPSIASFLQRAENRPLPRLIVSDQAGEVLADDLVESEPAVLKTLKQYGGD